MIKIKFNLKKKTRKAEQKVGENFKMRTVAHFNLILVEAFILWHSNLKYGIYIPLDKRGHWQRCDQVPDDMKSFVLSIQVYLCL